MEKSHPNLKSFASDVPMLVEAGFVAIKQVDEDSARKCFYAAMVIDPNEPLPVIGLGIVSLFKLDLDEAKKLFRLVLQADPHNQMAKTMLGIANLYSITEDGIKEGKHLIDEVMQTTDQHDLQELAKSSQELMKEIKKKMRDLHPLQSSHNKLPPHKRLKKD